MTMTADEANEYGNVDFSSAKEDKNYSGKWYFYECLYEITNNATFKMPMTGDDGKWKYGFIGFGIVMAVSAGSNEQYKNNCDMELNYNNVI